MNSELLFHERFPPAVTVHPSHPTQDNDTVMFLHHFHAPKESYVLEVGAYDELSSHILAENGFNVLGVDLRPTDNPRPNHTHVVADFVALAPWLERKFSAIFSTSAIEHFGLPVYGYPKLTEDLDAQAMSWMWKLLLPGGRCWITVPYGQHFFYRSPNGDLLDWRVYDRESLKSRIIQHFKVEKKLFFKSGPCEVREQDGLVSEEDADGYCGVDPHLTCLLQLRKMGS